MSSAIFELLELDFNSIQFIFELNWTNFWIELHWITITHFLNWIELAAEKSYFEMNWIGRWKIILWIEFNSIDALKPFPELNWINLNWTHPWRRQHTLFVSGGPRGDCVSTRQNLTFPLWGRIPVGLPHPLPAPAGWEFSSPPPPLQRRDPPLGETIPPARGYT